MDRYEEHQFYEEYSNDRAFMERESYPCRHCLHSFYDHHNARCPKTDDEESA